MGYQVLHTIYVHYIIHTILIRGVIRNKKNILLNLLLYKMKKRESVQFSQDYIRFMRITLYLHTIYKTTNKKQKNIFPTL